MSPPAKQKRRIRRAVSERRSDPALGVKNPSRSTARGNASPGRSCSERANAAGRRRAPRCEGRAFPRRALWRADAGAGYSGALRDRHVRGSTRAHRRAADAAHISVQAGAGAPRRSGACTSSPSRGRRITSITHSASTDTMISDERCRRSTSVLLRAPITRGDARSRRRLDSSRQDAVKFSSRRRAAPARDHRPEERRTAPGGAGRAPDALAWLHPQEAA